MKHVVILSGAGISAESGLKTFRADDGLWENHRVTDVATPEAWARDPDLVLRFYNKRRRQCRSALPNRAHLALVELEQFFHVDIVTQNIDDLHERAGSTHVHHLHGKINQARSTIDPSLVYELDHWEMKSGECCEKGSPLRPNIVWFGEAVPMIEQVVPLIRRADLVLVIGTSLQVYPAAGLLYYVSSDVPIWCVDPHGVSDPQWSHLRVIAKKAGDGVPPLVQQLMRDFV